MEVVLNLNCDRELDWLIALEYGRVDDGQPPDCWHAISDSFAYLLDEPEGRDVGFKVNDFTKFDPEDDELAPIWSRTRFVVPMLALRDASAGEIVVAASRFFKRSGSINREIFAAATQTEGWEAIAHWVNCLHCGDSMAHFGLGYTFYELGRYRQAYRHLRYYTEIAPAGSWNWCWLGKAALAIGEKAEATAAFRRAIRLTATGSHETEASELLAEIEAEQRTGQGRET